MRKLDSIMREGICPYFGKKWWDGAPVEEDRGSNDHIFFDAIGGKRTIRACKGCNDTFGHTFEAHTISRCLHPLRLLLANAKIPVAELGETWKNAFDWEGQKFNYVLREGGLVAELVNPRVERDVNDPKHLRVYTDTTDAAKRHLKQFSNSERFKLIAYSDGPKVEMPVEFTFNMDRQMRLAALKIAIAAATIAFPSVASSLAGAGKELCRGAADEFDPSSAKDDHQYHRKLDILRKPLSHTVYVEASENGLHAIVQFFGSFQFWASLSSDTANLREGVLGTLDPVLGEERFETIPRLNLVAPGPDGVVIPSAPIVKFNEAALARGANTAETLQLKSMRDAEGRDLALKPVSAWTWTGPGTLPNDFKFPN
jgi:hypothetical protein